MTTRRRRVAEWLGLRSSLVDAALVTREAAAGVRPPLRDAAGVVTPQQAVNMSMVYRAVDIHVTAATQLTLDQWRGATPIAPALLLREPERDTPTSVTVAKTVAGMALAGNAYWRLLRTNPRDPSAPVAHIEVLDPARVVIRDDLERRRRYFDVVTEWGRPLSLEAWEVAHLPRMRVPWSPYGLGPIQAAQSELSGAKDLRDYASGWFRYSGIPDGVLTTDQPLAPAVAQQWREQWESTEGRGTRVLGNGLEYKPILLSPRDAQFLESQQFTVTQVARLMGVPASLMLAAVEGNSQTYANVEQDWMLDLAALAGVLAHAAVMVGNDSGPRHLAQAVGARTAAVYWFGNVVNAGPLGRGRHRVQLGWTTRCPVCGRDATQVGWTAERCAHDVSFVADVPVAAVRDDALRLLDEAVAERGR